MLDGYICDPRRLVIQCSLNFQQQQEGRFGGFWFNPVKILFINVPFKVLVKASHLKTSNFLESHYTMTDFLIEGE